VRTVGRFVWEQFGREHVEPAKRAFDVVYSLTGCERERYATLGIESPRVRWGIHPELLDYARDRDEPEAAAQSTVFFYPAGFLTRRKPVKELLRAFRHVQDSSARLVVKGQVERKVDLLERAERRDPRIEVVLEDLPSDAHLRRFAAADVCVAPSRWEGLGLHLYEAMALGLPVITNDNPPMNEVIRERDNGLLVRARRRGRAPSGIPAYAPSARDLARAMREALDPGLREQLAKGVIEARERLRWEHTIADYGDLISSVR
jgi:1,2-diacylglycerol 3-alpha-glucosyltransferase